MTATTIQEQPLVRVDMMAAPLNPADVMCIHGRYPSPFGSSSREAFAASLRASPLFSSSSSGRTVAGSEGWGRIVEIVGGASASSDANYSLDLKEGDCVVPGVPGMGTMRSSLWLPANNVVPLSRGSELLDKGDPTAVAPLFQTAGTALRMLEDFVDLQRGDIVVQNAGNSAVGLMASQLVSSNGVKTVSLVRRGDRSTSQYDELVEYLTVTGKNVAVFAEEDLTNDSASFRSCLEHVREMGQAPPRLALNAVGGVSSSLLLNMLGDSGTMVTYGGMSQQPIQVKTTQFIFRDKRLVGYWHSRWMAQQSSIEERVAMMDRLVSLVLDASLQCPPVKSFHLSEFQAALEFEANQSNQAIRRKVVFDCREH